ncbi:MAG: hypothetical protein E5X23_24900 [Mesorhizobium sp.]|nr:MULTISPECIES: hypothetical protein [unclassified Mesorhizobium]TGV91658.1 hypothetical protein EN801_011860 [Mesorhizobium sp. M00.F.Ca.ET.158.01.1.1]AZO58908.1 hypothetical protein EJ078_06020 [Mesorhizobium sp. M1A.F.Ca.IN.022.06.1.1]MCT2579047.1 hypothetical protein [Mesorhizobium sp. P13.3]MDF3167987.1 hypothetical protein [Mesorhizobium sp. P16.1]MDF3180106.1 hypothetical protein [Mesorhizobium sp. P17.1]
MTAHRRLITDLAAIDKQNRAAAESFGGEPHHARFRSAGMQGITRVTMWGDTVFEEGAAQGLVEQCDYVYTRLLPGWGAGRFRRRAQA